MDTSQVVARFESERQALALMSHPTIAGIHDGGATEDGRPYFAMELVRGEPLTEYCDKNRLTIKERLELFIQVCEGVQHAHQKGIIHRDLKPSNILVTLRDDKPVPKIIDFGVAKATSQRLTDKTLYTQLGQWMGTPVYMGPEQAEMRGIDVDTRSDVYSPGVILYELLAGALPFDPTELREAGFEGFARVLRETEPKRPSTRVHTLARTPTGPAGTRRLATPALEKELRGDLDWITMKALEKDRVRRYETAHALALDLRRHLDDEPVTASPPSSIYRLRKLIRRRKGTFAAAGAVLLTLVVGVIGTSWGMLRALKAERQAADDAAEARRQTAIAEAVNDFLNDDLLAAVAPSASRGQGRDVTMIEALTVAAERIEEQSKDVLAGTLANLGRFGEAERLAATAIAESTETLGEQHPSTVAAQDTGARAPLGLGRANEAESILRRQLAILEERRNRGEGTADDDMLALSIRVHMGMTLAGLGRRTDAEGFLLGSVPKLSPREAATTRALEFVVRFYEAWDREEPGQGHAAQAAEWRQRLEGR